MRIRVVYILGIEMYVITDYQKVLVLTYDRNSVVHVRPLQ
jgi:hypothetical protein